MDLFKYPVSCFMTLGLKICIRLLGYSNKTPVTTEIYCLIALEAKSTSSRH